MVNHFNYHMMGLSSFKSIWSRKTGYVDLAYCKNDTNPNIRIRNLISNEICLKNVHYNFDKYKIFSILLNRGSVLIDKGLTNGKDNDHDLTTVQKIRTVSFQNNNNKDWVNIIYRRKEERKTDQVDQIKNAKQNNPLIQGKKKTMMAYCRDGTKSNIGIKNLVSNKICLKNVYWNFDKYKIFPTLLYRGSGLTDKKSNDDHYLTIQKTRSSFPNNNNWYTLIQQMGKKISQNNRKEKLNHKYIKTNGNKENCKISQNKEKKQRHNWRETNRNNKDWGNIIYRRTGKTEKGKK